MNKKIKSNLKEVPETMLWTLHNRATEALRKDAIIKDDKCIEIYNSLDYDYRQSFGNPEPSHAVRSLIFDNEIIKFLKLHPNGTIINLGEGLETQCFRVKENKAKWFSIDLPEAINIREQFIKPTEKHQHIPLSVLDRKWIQLVPKDEAVFITAQGLFMYFHENEIKLLLQDILSEFKTGYLMFDTIPKWISNNTMSKKGWQKTKKYTTPKMPWGINRNEVKKISKWSSSIKKIDQIPFVFPRGFLKYFFSLINFTPGLNNYAPTIVLLHFNNQKKEIS